jgi:hypothetical protein
MDYRENPRIPLRDSMVGYLSGIDTINVLRLIGVILDLQEKINELEYELKNIKFEMKVKTILPEKSGPES